MPPKDRARRQVDKNRIEVSGHNTAAHLEKKASDVEVELLKEKLMSNLTRLLQDSLLEETISTLEYATRAKRITNVPVAQINIEKKASDVEELLKEKLKVAEEEISSLKRKLEELEEGLLAVMKKIKN
ncbi:4090_t:CDS:2 [Entrophospora sp. SA101]|nr:4090_t:CDS:2 [Entrophospora sp. SA101]